MTTQTLFGGQSSTVILVGTHGESLFSPAVSPEGPMVGSSVALNALTLVRRGTVKVTAEDAQGKPFQATVIVDCRQHETRRGQVPRVGHHGSGE